MPGGVCVCVRACVRVCVCVCVCVRTSACVRAGVFQWYIKHFIHVCVQACRVLRYTNQGAPIRLKLVRWRLFDVNTFLLGVIVPIPVNTSGHFFVVSFVLPPSPSTSKLSLVLCEVLLVSKCKCLLSWKIVIFDGPSVIATPVPAYFYN